MHASTRKDFLALDAEDALAPCREQFVTHSDEIYLIGNSLGLQTRATREAMVRFLDAGWGRLGVRGWLDHGWVDLPQRAGDKIARLIGAAPGTVIVADSTSVNLFKVAAMALRLQQSRPVMLTEQGNFPTDAYVLQGLSRFLGEDAALHMVPREDLPTAIERHQPAVVMLTHVHYRSGEVFDMAAITQRAHRAGALMIWDLSHSAGALPVHLDACDVDFAVGCGYKYFNGGPGAPGYLYVNARLQGAVQPAVAGWFGHQAPFAMQDQYLPAAGIKRHLTGTPPIASLIALDAALDVFGAVDLDALRTKSQRLGDLFIERVAARCAAHGLRPACPQDPEKRGSQVSFSCPEGYAVMQALIARGVVGDFRAPDVIRFGLTPLYTRYVDVFDAVEILLDVMETEAWKRPEFRKLASVT